ncbi:hypothetical protein JCM8115_005985 [Rhodotorula mucilaginosa]
MAYNQQYGQQPQYPQQAYYQGPPGGGGDKGPQMYQNGAPGMQQGYYPPPQQGQYQGPYQGQQPRLPLLSSHTFQTTTTIMT